MRTRVVVSSSNQVKLNAVTQAFSQFFEGCDVDVVSIPSDSGIPHGQPWGMQHTYEGAMTRLDNMATSDSCRNTLSSDKDCNWFLVSVENGVIPILSHTETQGHDVACVVVRRVSDGVTKSAFSSSRPYPLSEIQEQHRQKSFDGSGKSIQEYYEKLELPMTRKDQVVQATLMSLASLSTPRFHE